MKESGFISGVSKLEDKRLLSQSPSPEKMGEPFFKTHLHISVEAEVFKRERGKEQRSREGAEKFSTCR